ncbi:hypothetical protein ACQEU8_25970 [Streptomyces sp. CA-250714]|uniref:hypothetical protein n=1 Tax=Streptomyces sp. CA-250714 TaxID=3240060 RepID=UPI003D8E1CD7
MSGGTGPDLAHSGTAKRRAARYLERHLGPDARAAGQLADEATDAVTGGGGSAPWAPGRQGPATFSPRGGLRGGLRGWEVRAGLGHRRAAWHRHSTQLVRRLRAEMTALLGTNVLFTDEDQAKAAAIRAAVRAPSRSRLDLLFSGAGSHARG